MRFHRIFRMGAVLLGGLLALTLAGCGGPGNLLTFTRGKETVTLGGRLSEMAGTEFPAGIRFWEDTLTWIHYDLPDTDSWRCGGMLDAFTTEAEILSRLGEPHSVQQQLNNPKQRFLCYLIDRTGAVTGRREDAYGLLELNLQGESLAAIKLYLYEYEGRARFSFRDGEGHTLDFNHSPAELSEMLGETPEISQIQYDLLRYHYPAHGLTAHATGDILLELDCDSRWQWDGFDGASPPEGDNLLYCDTAGQPVDPPDEWARSFATLHAGPSGGVICQLFARE